MENIKFREPVVKGNIVAEKDTWPSLIELVSHELIVDAAKMSDVEIFGLMSILYCNDTPADKIKVINGRELNKTIIEKKLPCVMEFASIPFVVLGDKEDDV